MDFYQKYELLGLLKDEGVKVFNARETATGRQITVFLFVGEQARLHADLLEQLRASQRPGRADLLEVGDNQGTPFVATEPLGGLADLKRKAAALPAPPAAPKAGRPPDAFTRVGVWHIPAPTLSGGQGATPVTPPPPPTQPPPVAPPAPPAQAAPGEFTRMFQAPAAPQPMGEAAPPAPPQPMGEAAPPAPLPAPPTQATPGEFTRMFQAPAAPQPMGEAAPPAARPASGAPPPAPPVQAAPGEFTRLFQASAPPQPMGEAAPPAARPASGAPPPAPPAQAAPGEFTRMFQASAPPQPMGEAAPPAGRTRIGRSAAGATRASRSRRVHTVFSVSALAGAGSRRLDRFSHRQRAPPKPPPPVSSAPGEFTRIFGRGDLPAAQAASREGAPPEFRRGPNSHRRPRRRHPPDRGSIRGCFRLSRSRNRSHRRRPRPRLRLQRPRPPPPRKCPGSCWRSSWRWWCCWRWSPSWPSL